MVGTVLSVNIRILEKLAAVVVVIGFCLFVARAMKAAALADREVDE